VKTRRTRQLATIHEIVATAHDHPTAEQVCDRARRRVPRISLGTVYRNLQKLEEQQQVRVVHLHDRPTRYDGMLQEHDHFLCERCGMVADLAQSREARPNWSRLYRAGYRVRAQALTFYGLCPQCRRSEERPSRAGRDSAHQQD
jgi:Fe2+ or Zn2+ uptake regulation protein